MSRDHTGATPRVRSCRHPDDRHGGATPGQRRMRVLLVVGARPNFMKAAPIVRAMAYDREDMIMAS